MGKSHFVVGEAITAVVRNTSGEDVTFLHCGNKITLVLERREGSSWSDALGLNGPICPTASGTLILGPGDTQTLEFSAKMAGEFRIRAEFGKGVTRIGYFTHSSPFVIQSQ